MVAVYLHSKTLTFTPRLYTVLQWSCCMQHMTDWLRWMGLVILEIHSKQTHLIFHNSFAFFLFNTNNIDYAKEEFTHLS